MTLLDFARGPALEIAFAVFVLGVCWRLLAISCCPGPATNPWPGPRRRLH